MLRYLGYRTVQLCAALVPPSAAYAVCALAGTLWFYCAPCRRKAVIDNEARILSQSSDRGEPAAVRARRAARQVFSSFCIYLYEFFRFGRLSAAWIERHVDIVGLDHLQNALEAKRGAIALTIHLGNWELGARVTAASGFPVNAVALAERDPRITSLFFHARERGGVKVFGVGSAVKEILRALGRNEVVALLADFDPTDRGMTVNFFGKPVLFSRGPFAIAAKTHAPVVPCVLVRGGKKKYQLVFDEPVLMEEGKQLETEIIERLERFIAAYPSQWCIFRDVWKSDP